MEIQNATPPPLNPRRILVIRRNRLGDMICTVPMLHALRRHFPQAHLTVACDAEGAPVARACPAVNTVQILARGLIGLGYNAMRLRGYDLIIAVKGGFDKRIARLARLSGAPIRIGMHPSARTKIYTHPVPLPPGDEHQILTCLRLLEPLGITDRTIDLTLRLPAETIAFARAALEPHLTRPHAFLVVVNISSNRPYPLAEEQLVTLVRQLANERHALVALSSVPVPAEKAKAERIRVAAQTANVFPLETPTTLHLAAVIAQAALLITPEGGPGHLAAALGTPTIVLWSEGPFEKWKTYAANHRYLRLDQERTTPALDELAERIDELVTQRSSQ